MPREVSVQVNATTSKCIHAAVISGTILAPISVHRRPRVDVSIRVEIGRYVPAHKTVTNNEIDTEAPIGIVKHPVNELVIVSVCRHLPDKM